MQTGQIHGGVFTAMSGRNRGRYAATIGAALTLSAILFGIAAYIYGLGYGSAHYQAEANAYSDDSTSDTEKRVRNCFTNSAVAAEVGPCVAEAIETGRESRRSENDLKAQRDMAEWAFGMLVVSAAGVLVTSIGTGILLWQIKLTRDAVIDTGKATKAMERQNEIAQNAQRAWVNIEAELTDAKLVGQHGIGLSYKVIFKNTGNTIATDFQAIVKFMPMDKKALDHIEACFQEWRSERKQNNAVLIPNEESFHLGEANYVLYVMPWFGEGKEAVYLIVLVATYYRLPNDETWRMNERAFSIGLRGDPLTEMAFFKDFPDNLGPEHLILRRFGRSVAN